MSAPLGNDYAMKFKTPEERQELCRKYCLHIEQGFSDASFIECDPDTIQRYIKDYAQDFPTDLIERAKRKRLLFWETVGIHGTIGIPVEVNGKPYRGFNAKSWEFNMKNRFGWKDRTDITSDSEKIQSPILYIPVEDPNK